MIKFETINELTLKVTTTGNDVIFTKTGAFIAGDCSGNTNYRFEKVLLGPQKSLAQAALGSLMRRVTGENIPLTKVTMNGPSETYYAESAQHVVAGDDTVDDLFNQVKNDVIAHLRSEAKDPDDCIDVMMFAKYLEKIGDHAVNIANWAIFQETGEVDHIRLL